MNMFWELLEAIIKCMIVFQELNCDPVKKSVAVVRRCSVKKVFLKISQNSQKSTCVRVSFLRKLQVWGLIILIRPDYSKENTCENEVLPSTIERTKYIHADL